MRYVFAIILPPLAVLLCRKPMQFVFNLLFWLLSLVLLFFGIGIIGWFLCMVHALVLCATQDRNRQMDRLVNAIQLRPDAGAKRP